MGFSSIAFLAGMMCFLLESETHSSRDAKPTQPRADYS